MKKNIKIVFVLIVICFGALGVLGYINSQNNKEGQVNNTKTDFNTNENIFENETINTETDENTINNEEEENINKGWIGNQYIDKSKNITFNLPEGWNKYTAEDIKAMIGDEVQGLTEEEQNAIDKYTNYDMMVTNVTGNSNVIITINELEEEMTANEYLLDLKEALQEVNILEYEYSDIYSTDICGEEYEILELKVKDYTLEQQYCVRVDNNELIAIVITATTNEDLNKILECFEEN